jgi:PEP-CTERM motif
MNLPLPRIAGFTPRAETVSVHHLMDFRGAPMIGRRRASAIQGNVKRVKVMLGARLLATALVTVLPTVQAASVTVFSTDFNVGVPAEFSGVTTTESVQGFSGAGNGTNVFSGNFLRNITGGNPTGTASSPTSLTLAGLPAHTSIDLRFLLAIIDSWDGSDVSSGINQPDYFNVKVDGIHVFRETIDHENLSVGTYTTPPPGVLIAWGNRFDAGVIQNDIGFDMGLEPAFLGITHTSNTLTVEWFADGAGWQGNFFGTAPTDETWAIDNVEVVLNGVNPGGSAPEPTSLALLGMGLAGIAALRRRKQ